MEVVTPKRKRYRPSKRKTEIQAEDANWFVIECIRCYRLFDVPRTQFRVRETCDECR